jgi:DNA repair protein RecO (recombination protein O)
MMNRQRTYRTRAVVVRRRDQGDADRILTLFTPHLGKLDVIAKGVRKTTSRKSGHLELFTHASLLVAQARTWDIVTEVSTVESFRHIRTDLDTIGHASYVCELIDRFTEAEDENPLLWELLLFALRYLDEAGKQPVGYNVSLMMRWFEMHLLSITGFQPQFFHCLECQNSLTPTRNFLSLANGGIFCATCAQRHSNLEETEVDVLKMLRYLQSQPWDLVQGVSIRPHIMQRIENILYRYLLTILERQLHSTDFLRRLRTLRPQVSTP